jgi:integrase
VVIASTSSDTASRVRALNRLSAIRVSKTKEPGLYEDGGGLRLVVTDRRVKRWTLRITIRGRRVERGLGVWPAVSLEEARQTAERFRKAAREGRDARLDEGVVHRRMGVSFKDAFEAFFEIRCQQLSNSKHVEQWRSTMASYVFPVIGRRPVAEITAAEVIEVLNPIWFTKPETASRVLQRIKATFDSAILRGTREKANPCIGITRELGTDHRKVTHHPALPWREVPAFVATLRDRPIMPSTRLLFEFLILTIARSGEARGAIWSEIDLSNRTWTIAGFDSKTGRRMKGGETHVVPLCDCAIKVLAEARKLHGGALIFPGAKGQPLSDNVLSKLMRDWGIPGTPHGFRSAFKDWAAENGVRDEVSEAALAHTDRDRVRGAYRRTRFLEERRLLMQRWADYIADTAPAIHTIEPSESASVARR